MSRVPKIRSLGQWRYALLTAVLVATVATSGILVGQGGGAAFAAEHKNIIEAEPALVVAPEVSVVSSDAAEFRFEVLLKNPSEVPIRSGSVVLTIDNQRAEVAEDLLGAGERGALELSRVEVAETGAGEDQRVEVVVVRDDFPLVLSRASGVYPVRAEFLPVGIAQAPGISDAAGVSTEAEAGSAATLNTDAADGGASPELYLAASTAIVWNGIDTVSPLPLTLIVPIVLPSSVQTLPTRDELTLHSSRLLQVFDAAEQRHATIAVDPRIIAGIRSLGTAAPSGATDLLNRVEQSASPIFLLQFADADPAVQSALGMSELMQPIGLSHATALGTFEPPSAPAAAPGTGAGAAAGAAEATAASDTTAGKPEVPIVDPTTGTPTLAGLLTLENSRPGAWPAGGEADSATLVLLQDAGLTSLVLDSTNVSNATSPRVTIGDFDALIADAATGAAARGAMAGETNTDRLAGTADLTTRLALSAQNSAAGAVLALDRGAFADLEDPLQIFQTIDNIAWVQTTSERQQPGGTAALRAGAATEGRRELLRASILRSAQIDELAPLLKHPSYLVEYQRERVLESLATRYAEPGIDFAEVAAATTQRDDELLRGVRPIVTESTQLVGTQSNVPVTLGNALPFEAVVNLKANPVSAGITLPEREFKVRVPAAGSTAVLVPVHSRISSGESGLALEVRDGSAEHSFSITLLPLTLSTTIETILMWVLGSAAALLLGFGTLRSIRRKRKDQAEPGNAADSSKVTEPEVDTVAT